jgi:hypothetical protein
MNSELDELMRFKKDIEETMTFLVDQRKIIEDDLDKKNYEYSQRLYEVNMKIHELHNKLGAHIVLCNSDEKALRHELITIEHILTRVPNDNTKIVLSYEEPCLKKPYSIHIDMVYYRIDLGFNITIKTKCPAVETIVRETLSCYRSDPTISEWHKSYMSKSIITFNHNMKYQN